LQASKHVLPVNLMHEEDFCETCRHGHGKSGQKELSN
jgi:hypothetical protein